MLYEALVAGAGFTGALTLIYLADTIGRRLRMVPVAAVHFSPKGGCTEAIVRELARARREVLVQAYSFTCPAIAEALASARKRGVEVRVLLDRSNEKETYSELGELEKHGLALMIDAHHAIAHNKVMVIDCRTVLTGSFNFTRQAEQENAENLLVVRGDPDVIAAYRQNFQTHWEHAQPPGSAATSGQHTHSGHPPTGGSRPRAA
jgi:phosphatidylserine/phosphatidylglycerophosphate/cardiolipin synthase-like enzyme